VETRVSLVTPTYLIGFYILFFVEFFKTLDILVRNLSCHSMFVVVRGCHVAVYGYCIFPHNRNLY